MASYNHLTINEKIVMTFLVVVSLLAGVPALIKVFRKAKCNFLATIFMMSMVSSLFYHLSEIYEYVPFLDCGQWQRMDNVFTISSIELVLLFLCGCLHEGSHFLEYSCLINTIIIQEKDPWNFNYTIWPIMFYLLLGLLIRFFYIRPRFHVKYFRRNMILALIFLGIGTLFYLDGLDDDTDYLRASHGMWHLSVSIFGWFAFEGVEVSIKVGYFSLNASIKKTTKTYINEDEQQQINQQPQTKQLY